MVNLTTNCSMSPDFFPDAACFLGDRLVVRGHTTSGCCFLDIYDFESGVLVDRSATKCGHYLPNGSLLSFQIRSILLNKELLVEGCPHSTCESIRVYDVDARQIFSSCENVKPHKMCAGPSNTLLMLDWKTDTLLRLVMFEGLRGPKLQVNCKHVSGMSYTDCYRLVILASKFIHQVTAIHVDTGDAIWTFEESGSNIALHPDDVIISPQGWICVTNGNNLLALDRHNGTHVDTLLENTLDHIKKVVWSGDKVAVKHGLLSVQITCFKASFRSSQSKNGLRFPNGTAS